MCFEGIDRSGKSTQSAALVDAMRRNGSAVTHICFPDRTTASGKVLDAYLRGTTEVDDHVVHLLFSANRWEAAGDIRKDLAKGTTVVLDRYAYSGLVFSAAKGLDQQWCRAPDAGLPLPDAILYMELDVDTAATRGKFGEERYEHEEFQRTVLELYNRLRDEAQNGDGAPWYSIDASQSAHDVHGRVHSITKEVVDRCGGKPIGDLW